MSESINALVKAKEQGQKDFDALPASTHTKLDTLAEQINLIEASVNKSSVEGRIQQAELLNKGFMACKDDFMTFGAWFNQSDPKVGLSLAPQRANEIIHLGKFCKNKNTGDLNLSVLYELSKPKWVKGANGEINKEMQKAVSSAYTKIRRWTPRNQTGSNAKECIIEERRKLGYEPPVKSTAYAKPVQLSDVKLDIADSFNDYRMNFQVNEGELEELAEYVENLMDEWIPHRRDIPALPAPLIDVESGFNWIDTLSEQDTRDLIAYAQEKLDA